MILFINDIRTIADVQDKFNLCFQFLKIEFYDTVYAATDSPFNNPHITPDQQIGEIRKEHNKGFLEIKSWYGISKVEQEFRELYGLRVHIFFRTNGRWKQVPYLDDRTLAALNKLGELEGRTFLS
jgi:hypothetical protein